jgi:hypothetical protein
VRTVAEIANERMMDEFERWFLVVYTTYIVAAIAGLFWVGEDRDGCKGRSTSRRAFWQRNGDRQ